MLLEHFLPLGYRFVVYFEFGSFSDLKDGNAGQALQNGASNLKKAKNAYDVMFQSVSGLSVDIETEEYAEGGENSFKHTLPVRTKYPNLVLTRGLASSSEVSDWVRRAVEDFQFEPANLTIILQNELRAPMHVWNVKHAIPVRWSVDSFNAEESKIVIETLELKYNTFKAMNPESLGVEITGA